MQGRAGWVGNVHRDRAILARGGTRHGDRLFGDVTAAAVRRASMVNIELAAFQARDIQHMH